MVMSSQRLLLLFVLLLCVILFCIVLCPVANVDCVFGLSIYACPSDSSNVYAISIDSRWSINHQHIIDQHSFTLNKKYIIVAESANIYKLNQIIPE
jgi:hypothetical protein